jgi:PTS system mannose-specific IIA component
MPIDKSLPLLGMVLVTHGQLAAEMVTAMEHVVGPQRSIATVCIGPNDNMEMRRNEIAAAIRKVDGGRGVIMLTDLFGGTPSNLAISLLEQGKTEVIAGVNLPMLIRLESARKTMDLHAAVLAAKEAGQKYISVASEMLGVNN